MRPPNTKESLLEKTVMETGCWLYQGATEHGGHCKVRWGGKKVFIHRLSAHLHWGFDLDSPTLILHKICCTHTNCWNPEHLYEGTHKDNALDSILSGTFKNVIAEAEGAKTHCSQGHEYTEDNTYIYKTGKRGCRACNKERARKRTGYYE